MKLYQLNYFAVLLLAFSVSFGACKKETYDVETVTEEEIPEPDTVACNIFYGLGFTNDNELYPVIYEGAAQRPFEFEWSTGSADSSIFLTESGSYAITITDAVGCTLSYDFSYIEDCADLTAEIIAETDNMGVTTLSTVVSLEGVVPIAYEWSTGETTPSIQVTASGIYTVFVYGSSDPAPFGECATGDTIEL